MARSSWSIVAAVLLAPTALGACAFSPAPPPAPAAVVVAPTPQAYTCAQSHQAGAEFDALPAGSALRVYMNDYAAERRELRRLLGLPDPPKCPPAAVPASPAT
jgi:uncharacterized lipoprotein YbaY